MTRFLVGAPERRQELARRCPALAFRWQGDEPPARLPEGICLFDLDLDQHPQRFAWYAAARPEALVGCAVLRSLGEIAAPLRGRFAFPFVGINALPSFLDRPEWECSLYQPGDEDWLRDFCAAEGLAYVCVADQRGMATPRVLALILNEALLLLQERGAQQADIDRAMRLGAAYPRGPLAWVELLGPATLLALLDALREGSGNPRFSAARILREAAEKGWPLPA